MGFEVFTMIIFSCYPHLPFKKYLKAKEEIMEIQIFHHAKI